MQGNFWYDFVVFENKIPLLLLQDLTTSVLDMVQNHEALQLSPDRRKHLLVFLEKFSRELLLIDCRHVSFLPLILDKTSKSIETGDYSAILAKLRSSKVETKFPYRYQRGEFECMKFSHHISKFFFDGLNPDLTVKEIAEMTHRKTNPRNLAKEKINRFLQWNATCLKLFQPFFEESDLFTDKIFCKLEAIFLQINPRLNAFYSNVHILEPTIMPASSLEFPGLYDLATSVQQLCFVRETWKTNEVDIAYELCMAEAQKLKIQVEDLEQCLCRMKAKMKKRGESRVYSGQNKH